MKKRKETIKKKKKKKKKKNTHRDKIPLWVQKTIVTRIDPPTVALIFDFMDNDLTVSAMIQCTCKKLLSMYILLNLTVDEPESTECHYLYWTRNNLLHLDPGLFQYEKYIDMRVNIHRVISLFL